MAIYLSSATFLRRVCSWAIGKTSQHLASFYEEIKIYMFFLSNNNKKKIVLMADISRYCISLWPVSANLGGFLVAENT